MAESTDVMSQIFNKANLSPKEQVTDWDTANLKKKGIGSKIAGKFVGFWYVAPKGVFKAQIGVALRDLEDAAVVYGLNLSEYFKDKAATYQLGDLLGFEYTHDKPNKDGMNATKVIACYNLSETERIQKGETSKGTQMFVETDNTESESTADDNINPEDIPF